LGNSQWALHIEAILCQLQLVLAERSQHYQKRIQQGTVRKENYLVELSDG